MDYKLKATMQVKIKKLNELAVVPKYAKNGDAGLDLTAIDVTYEPSSGLFTYSTGLAIEIPEGYVGLLFPRSSLCKKELILTNHVGVIDSGYRGEIKAAFTTNFDYWGESKRENFGIELKHGVFQYYASAEDDFRDELFGASIYGVGDRIAQLLIIPYPTVEFEEVEELSKTERGESGYGSSGN